MNASFEEKSVWVQLIGMVVLLGSYFAAAAQMHSAGVTQIIAYMPLFIAAVVLLVVVLVAGHIVIAITGRAQDADERDRLIGWRSESNSSWILGIGVLAAITALVMSIDTLLVAHLLLLSMILSEVAKYLFQLFYYRRGI